MYRTGTSAELRASAGTLREYGRCPQPYGYRVETEFQPGNTRKFRLVLVGDGYSAEESRDVMCAQTSFATHEC
eukprot:scaffold213654_cov42-Prasinocladus_malaysianus.AAC.1